MTGATSVAGSSMKQGMWTSTQSQACGCHLVNGCLSFLWLTGDSMRQGFFETGFLDS